MNKQTMTISAIRLTILLLSIAILNFSSCSDMKREVKQSLQEQPAHSKTKNSFENCIHEIKNCYPYDKTSTIETYQKDCLLEFQNGIQFPLDKPVFAKLHFDEFAKPSKILDAVQTEIIISVLNDTASYDWGEIGTPYFDRFFTFHDKEGNCIGFTQFSFDGQTYSTPSLAKMKWGMLTDSARATLLLTINPIK